MDRATHVQTMCHVEQLNVYESESYTQMKKRKDFDAWTQNYLLLKAKCLFIQTHLGLEQETFVRLMVERVVRTQQNKVITNYDQDFNNSDLQLIHPLYRSGQQFLSKFGISFLLIMSFLWS